MSRLFKALSLTLSVLTLSIVSVLAASCGSSGTQYRIFNAMSNPNATFNFDVTINGAIVTPVGGMGFQYVQPSKGYSSISSGSDTVAVYQAGQAGTAGATALASASGNLSGSNQYTIVLMGNSPTGGPPNGWTAQAFPDNNTLPAAGNVEFRVINAAPSLPGAVNIYIVPTESIAGATPTFTGVAYGQPSQQPTEYATLPTGSYWVYVTTPQGTPLFPPYNFPSGATTGIYTFMLTDTQNGFTFFEQPIPLTDMQ